MTNLFTGNVNDLTNRLKDVPEDIRKSYAEFAFKVSGSKGGTKKAMDYLSDGDKKIFDRYQKQAESYQFAGQGATTYQLSDEPGGLFDIQTYLSGQPDYWLQECETDGPAKIRNIKINVAMPFWVKQTDCFDKLIKIVGLIDSLEASGQRLEVEAVSYFAPYLGAAGKKYSFSVMLKEASEPLNLQLLVTLLASPILVRFAFLSLQKHFGDKYTPVSDISQEQEETTNDKCIYIPSISWDYEKLSVFNRTNPYQNINLIELYKLAIN
jgi:hypothetical protein